MPDVNYMKQLAEQFEKGELKNTLSLPVISVANAAETEATSS